MPLIILETKIKAPIDICFDLSRSIDLHMISTESSGEQAIAGRCSGLIELGESVTWKAKHLGVWQTLSSKITALEQPRFFVDEMVHGAFRSFRHEQLFVSDGDYTVMTDKFQFESPLGWMGKLANRLFLEKYIVKLLRERNAVIREYAESEKWQQILRRT